MIQIAMENTFHQDHIFNVFAWGNAKSLKVQEAQLLPDLKKFYETNYAPDRIAIVVQVKTDDNCATLRKWVEGTFGMIQKPKFGIQDFAKVQRDGQLSGEAVGQLPYKGNEDEIIIINSAESIKQISLIFTLPNDPDVDISSYLKLLSSLLSHQGEGSLYDLLTTENYILFLEVETNELIRTPMRFITC